MYKINKKYYYVLKIYIYKYIRANITRGFDIFPKIIIIDESMMIITDLPLLCIMRNILYIKKK